MARIMIVEDDSIILSNLSQLLGMTGLDVLEASDGQEAWTLLEAGRGNSRLVPNVILSDLMMPNLDGFQLLSAVRADRDFSHIPFVLLTARSDSSDVKTAFDLGASDYLVKPFELDELILVVKRQLGNAGVGVGADDPLGKSLEGLSSLFD